MGLLQDKVKMFEGVFLKGVTTLAEQYPDLGQTVLLHAGPGFTDSNLPSAVHNAAVNALIFEGVAETSEEAATLLANGSVSLRPAQDLGVVTPLAQVVSASMPLFVVGDDAGSCLAPLVEGAPPALRFGSRERGCIDNLRKHRDLAFAELQPALASRPVAIAEVIGQALGLGNDCHTLTDQANNALLERLEGLSAPYHGLLEESPGFVLPVIMGASGWAMSRNHSPIAAAGGNGQRFGIRLRGAKEWVTVEAEPPVGPFFPGRERDRGLAAIGDSAVIDVCGLGGQALSFAPTLAEEWQTRLPVDALSRADKVLDPQTGFVSPDRVLASAHPPIINLAMVSAEAGGGILGKGFYQPPLGLFEACMAEAH